MYRKTYVEINIDNLKNNVKNILNYYNDYKYYFGVVKGNCYGHGTKYVINELIESGINYLAVSSLEEALEARAINETIPILCLEPINLEYIDICIKNNITLTIHDYNYAKELLLKNINNKIKIHFKIDSGMNRLGFKSKEEIKEIYEKIKGVDNIEIEGIFTHFATTGISDKEWKIQLENFKKLTSEINLEEIKIIHLANSTSFLNHHKIEFANGIRLGIAMYGYDPTPKYSETGLKNKLRKIKRDLYIKKNCLDDTITKIPIELKPAFKLYTEVIQVKDIKKGEFVGYSAFFRAEKDMKIGILAIGYADGIFRKSRGRNIEINGKIFKQIGVIGMGMCAVEVDDSVKMYDRANLIGEKIPITEVAKKSGTSIYEILCNVDKSVPRIYIKNGEAIN